MKTTIVSDNLIMLTRRNLVLPNAYLVREDDGFTLIDTTTRGAAAKLTDAASRAGAKIRRVALTHGHGDHVGSLDALKQRLGEDIEVLMPELDARIHAGEKVVEGKLAGSWPKVATRPDVALQDGDRVGSLEVIACPGHSPGHVAFLDTRDRSLIAGDVFTSIGSVQVTNHFYLRFPLAQMATWDKAKDLESAQALTRLTPTLLAVGHGPAVPHPVPAMEASLRSAVPVS
ncbi:MAG: MBL fold metallo-hydrolase [Solirubrobacterales bacterium]|nr:MBL fold metallo-hydrolase [Solirubrobacterales bacterium]